MKKSPRPRLTLSRTTVRRLTERQLGRAAGGVSGYPDCNCSLGMCDSDYFQICLPDGQ